MQQTTTYYYIAEIERHFSGVSLISIESCCQLEELQLLLNDIRTDNSANDKWGYNWNSEEYFSHKGYRQITEINDAPSIFRWTWKFFFCLLLRDRLNNRELLKENYGSGGLQLCYAGKV
jgi:hypothetical protein